MRNGLTRSRRRPQPPAGSYCWFARLRGDGTCQGSQSVKTTVSVGVRGYHAGKTIKARMRHAPVDLDGWALKGRARAAGYLYAASAILPLQGLRH